jgi:hypothetical protein
MMQQPATNYRGRQKKLLLCHHGQLEAWQQCSKIGSMLSYLVSKPLRTIPCQTNRHGQVIPAIAPTNIVHGQSKKIGETNAGETPPCNKQMLKKWQHALAIIFSKLGYEHINTGTNVGLYEIVEFIKITMD